MCQDRLAAQDRTGQEWDVLMTFSPTTKHTLTHHIKDKCPTLQPTRQCYRTKQVMWSQGVSLGIWHEERNTKYIHRKESVCPMETLSHFHTKNSECPQHTVSFFNILLFVLQFQKCNCYDLLYSLTKKLRTKQHQTQFHLVDLNMFTSRWILMLLCVF